MAWNGVVPEDPSMVPNYLPPKTYSKSTVRGLQDVDPYDFSNAGNVGIRNLAEGVRSNFLLNILNGFLNLGQLLSDISLAIRGLGSFGPGPLKDIRDGQLDIIDRSDLLSPLLDYGTAYMNTANGFSNVGQANFSNQIGPMQGCHITNGRIILEEEGLWDIRAALWFGSVGFGLGGGVGWNVRVLKPDGSIYSEKMEYFDTDKEQSALSTSSVVVPGANYQVQVYVTVIAATRSIIGGPARNRLTVQHISRDTTTGDTGQ
ncbi:hypothetical protein ACMTN4_07595 [Rhodococcus globerulus]|uniref:hypothetical protein n=1 Tax=Rhodococcus globerulus TaxID=33008 RepID=UPI0039E98689